MEDKKTKLKIEKEDFIEENVDYVFTIKDRNILDEQGQKENDQIDVLENTYIQENSKNAISSKNEYRYDNMDISKKDLDNQKNHDLEVEIDENGKIVKSQEDIQKIKEKLQNITNKLNENKQFSLNQKKNFKNDYFTKEEFKKRSKKKKQVQAIPLLLSSEIEEINSTITNKNNNVSSSFSLEENEEEIKLKQISQKGKNNISHNQILSRIINEDKEDIEEKEPKNEQAETITDYSLFLKSIPNVKEEAQKSNLIEHQKIHTLQDLKNGTASIVNIPLPNEQILYEKKNQENKVGIKTELPLITNEEQLDFEEPPTRKGVCIALDILKRRGLLAEEEGLGRYKDKSYTTNDYLLTDETLKNKNKKEINIEYRDELGRKLKPKEMARYQSHIFHGEGPGIRKTEKQLLREQNMQKLQNSSTLLNNKTMRYIKHEQNKKNTPFAVLQGKRNSSFL